MKHRLSATLTFLVLASLFSVPARADSDGYFCISTGYLAYEMRGAITAGVDGHVLKVVRVAPNRGIYVAGQVTLLDFEVYHLMCGESRIEISGWRNVITKYVIDILPTGELKTIGPIEYPEVNWRDAAKDGPTPQSLAIFPNGDPISVESLDSEHTYQLLRTWSHEKSKEGWDVSHIKSELVQHDKSGNTWQRLVLYERRNIENKD